MPFNPLLQFIYWGPVYGSHVVARILQATGAGVVSSIKLHQTTCEPITGAQESIDEVIVCGLLKLVPAAAHHFCLHLPATCLQPRTKIFSYLCKPYLLMLKLSFFIAETFKHLIGGAGKF